jgi:hypothetical protein
MRLNNAVFAPIPSARVRIAKVAKPGDFARERKAWRRSVMERLKD